MNIIHEQIFNKFLCLQGGISYQSFLRDIYEDLIQRLIELSTEENIFVSQPCRDNTLYLLKLVDEMLISEIDHKLPVYYLKLLPASLFSFMVLFWLQIR